MLSRFAQT
jgi:hypothetical protein